MTRSTFTKLLSLTLIMIVAAALGPGIVQSQSAPVRINLIRTTQSEFHSAVFSPDAKYLVTVGDRATVNVWDAASGKLLHVLFPPVGPDQIDPYFGSPSVVFGQGSDTFVSHWAGLTKRWDTASGKLISDVEDVALVDRLDSGSSSSKPSDPTAASSQSIIKDILVSAKETDPATGKAFQAEIAAYSAAGRIIATWQSSRKAIDIWSLESGQRLATLSATANLQTDLEGPPLVYDLAYEPAHVAQSVGSAQSVAISALPMAPLSMFLRPCKPTTTIGGRLTRRTDVFGDDEPQYRPVKNEQAFSERGGNEIARTRTDRNGRLFLPNLCSGTYTVHPGLASPRCPALRTWGPHDYGSCQDQSSRQPSSS
jgi:hypothetical protein